MVYVAIIILGLCLGSFVNAWVWRLHEQASARSKIKSKKLKVPKAGKSGAERDLSILHGRSMCVHCRHELAWYDLVPVISWVSLGGRCRYCHNSISWQYPVVELATAALFVLSYVYFPYQLSDIRYQILLATWLIVVVFFMAMIVYDLRWMILPNLLTYPLAYIAIVYALLLAATTGDFGVLVGAGGGVLAVFGLFYALFRVSDGAWIGGGDVKLGIPIGILAGSLVDGLLLIFVASLLGTIVMVPLLVSQRKAALKKHIPFGPFLIAATIIVFIFGANIVEWYQSIFIVV